MARFELERFPDKRLKLLVRFQPTTNFRVDPVTGEATWVPTLEETDQLYETLGMTNFYNINKPKIPQLKEQCIDQQTR
jgi:hypothetical protein